jgi:uncharacterized protein YdiU (UPF0061 family)
MGNLESLTWISRFLDETPGDGVEGGNPRQVPGACWSRVKPTKTEKPVLRLWSSEMGEILDLEKSSGTILGGSGTVNGMDPYAQRYGGHQFGNWAHQLGDGRAITLGEVQLQKEVLELQLKGAGRTPYSRFADGKAVLRSSIREFLCSEAMHHLGVPTTRALSLVTTGEMVTRDVMYDGNPAPEIGAVVCRIAPSFIRFGSFQIHTADGNYETLRTLLEHTIKHHFHGHNIADDNGIVAWLKHVAETTAEMISHWMRVGFVHGVMNTDNMSILGYTIDFGPYGWLEPYDPQWTPNTTDFYGRRYAYGRQPEIALWNLVRLANAIFPLINDSDALEKILHSYHTYFMEAYNDIRAQKIGLVEFNSTDSELLEELYINLKKQETDHNLFYRNLKNIHSNGDIDLDALLNDALYDTLTNENRESWTRWFKKYQQRLQQDSVPQDQRTQKMDAINPKYILRNWVAQLAIDESNKGNHQLIRDLLEMLKSPYEEQPKYDQYSTRRPEWARNKPGCSTLSCSS